MDPLRPAPGPGPTFRSLQISSPKRAQLSSNFVYVLWYVKLQGKRDRQKGLRHAGRWMPCRSFNRQCNRRLHNALNRTPIASQFTFLFMPAERTRRSTKRYRNRRCHDPNYDPSNHFLYCIYPYIYLALLRKCAYSVDSSPRVNGLPC